MPKRAIYSMIGLAIAVLLAVNVLVYAMSRNTVPRQIAKRIERVPVLNCLALGNSLVQAGFDEASFEQASERSGVAVKAVNAGLGSSSPVEHLLLLRHALRRPKKIECVYYGFFDLQLTTLPPTKQSDLIGNRAMLYYFEPAVVPAYFGWPIPEKLLFHTVRLFPALEERGVIWEKIEVVRRRMAAVGLPTERTNRFGRAGDFNVLEADSTASFVRECEREVSERQPLSRPVHDMIRLSRDRGSRVVMIEMPMSPSHRDHFYRTDAWKKYRSYLTSMLAAEGAAYVQASGWIGDDRMFADHVHMSPPGAELFSKKLASCRQVQASAQVNCADSRL